MPGVMPGGDQFMQGVLEAMLGGFLPPNMAAHPFM